MNIIEKNVTDIQNSLYFTRVEFFNDKKAKIIYNHKQYVIKRFHTPVKFKNFLVRLEYSGYGEKIEISLIFESIKVKITDNISYVIYLHFGLENSDVKGGNIKFFNDTKSIFNSVFSTKLDGSFHEKQFKNLPLNIFNWTEEDFFYYELKFA